ncbi:MAG: uridine kinase [Alistipes sp.]
MQLSILGMHPVLISLDDYFVEREKTPRDEKGDYDFEALEAVDVELFNDHLNRLLKGETVRIPRYNFITGKREFHEQPLQMEERSVLVIEGIHGLNPKLPPHVAADMKFKIYVSALTSIAMDNLKHRHDRQPADPPHRADHRTHSNSAYRHVASLGKRPPRGKKHIFRTRTGRLMFNSSLFYELSVLKDYVRPLLREVPDTVPEFGEAHRLLKFLDHFTSMDRFEAEIPPTSILREFIGGSCFEY